MFAVGLNLSELCDIITHCHSAHHGLNLILDPFGSGRTVLVSILGGLMIYTYTNQGI